jgi:hypothetical protein
LAGIDGTFYNVNDRTPISQDKSALPLSFKDETVFELTDYAISSFLIALKGKPLSTPALKDLTTTALKAVFPQLAAKYGENKLVTITVTGLDDIYFNAGTDKGTVDGSNSINFAVNTDSSTKVDAITFESHFAGSALFKSSGMTLTGKIYSGAIDNLKVTENNMGETIDASSLQAGFNAFVQSEVVAIN